MKFLYLFIFQFIYDVLLRHVHVHPAHFLILYIVHHLSEESLGPLGKEIHCVLSHTDIISCQKSLKTFHIDRQKL